MRILFILLLFVVTACDDPKVTQEVQEVKEPEFTLTISDFSTLPNWHDDDLKDLDIAFGRSCGKILKANPDYGFGSLKQAGKYQDWQDICEKFAWVDVSSPDNIRKFFEDNFIPYMVSAGNETNGLFTGYYEASLKGSRVKQSPYIYPLHKRPDDLIMVQLGDFRENLKGTRIAGRVIGGRLKPYENRHDIVNGNWRHNSNDDVLLWVDNAVDAFFVQIQGSGLVQMDDGSLMRIGYAGQNGHPYYAIGRELIKIDALTKENISMQSIRRWLGENPDKADEVMNSNKSYVFFREVNGEGAIGAQGVALTAGRSLAIDRTLISYGVPIWVDIEHPEPSLEREQTNIRRLMIAQDTGGAINGMVRADFFWGHGARAENMAGKMKSRGRYWVLLPNK